MICSDPVPKLFGAPNVAFGVLFVGSEALWFFSSRRGPGCRSTACWEPTDGWGKGVVVPSWRDTGLGTKKKAALWLVQEVGEGQVFTKQALRDAFPGVAQVDRRVRDLREHGWVIHTSKEEPALEVDEQRFVEQGEPVWEPGKGGSKNGGTLSAKVRRDVYERDGYLCQSCGISGGEAYDDDGFSTAQLSVARRTVLHSDGSTTVEFVTECDRCRVGARGLKADAGRVQERVLELSGIEAQIFRAWMKSGKRELGRVERLWGEYMSLPPTARAEVKEAVLGEE